MISIGQSVVFNQEINTDGTGLVQILLLDGTTFTVGPNSRIVIDEFVYNPAAGEARVVASVTKGAFRFIGGQTSRKSGGATINTPVGTIGIRGAMVEGNVLSSRSALISMIFGDEVVFQGRRGNRERIFKPGFTLVVGGGGSGADVRRRTKSDAASFQAALAGKTGSEPGGGASERPTDSTVANSGVAKVLSNLPDSMFLPPVKPVQASQIDTVEYTVANIDEITSEILTTEIVEGEVTPAGAGAGPGIGPAAAPTAGPVAGPAPQPDSGTGPEPVPVPEPAPELAGRVLTAPATYGTLGATYPAAGGRGFVGSTPETDRKLTFSQEGGRLISNDGGLNLPDLTGTIGDSGLEGVPVTEATGPGGPLAGTAYAGVGDFAAYFLGQNGDPAQPTYAIFGTGTDSAGIRAINEGAGIREYTLTQDPIRPSAAPFFATGIYGSADDARTTNFIVVEPNASASGEVETFLAWIDIEGSGASQKSAAMVHAASDTGGSLLAFEGERRGSFRPGATAGIYNMGGDIATIGGPDGSHLFGPDANHFVLGASLDPAGGYFDVSANNGAFTGNPDDGYLGDGAFSTHHVSNLISNTPQASVDRTSRNVTGYMNGMAESSANAPGAAYALRSFLPSFELALDATNHSVSAQGLVLDLPSREPVVTGMVLAFGATGSSPGGSTFVDDNRFGAVQNSNLENTQLLTDRSPSITHDSIVQPGSYIVSGRAAPIPGFQHCTSCDFLDWGWWGTSVTVGASGAIPNQRTEFVHMGTWVAGDITNRADLPNNISATYSGTALGNVTRGAAKYIAAGDMNMSYDFASRSGNMQISNFDGMSASGLIAELPNQQKALFLGVLDGSGVAGDRRRRFCQRGLRQ